MQSNVWWVVDKLHHILIRYDVRTLSHHAHFPLPPPGAIHPRGRPEPLHVLVTPTSVGYPGGRAVSKRYGELCRQNKHVVGY